MTNDPIYTEWGEIELHWQEIDNSPVDEDFDCEED
jgi:hypothetical protein